MNALILHIIVGILILAFSVSRISGTADKIIFLIMLICFIYSILNVIRNIILINRIDNYLKGIKTNNKNFNKLMEKCNNLEVIDEIDNEFSDENIHKLTGNGMQPVVANMLTTMGVLGTFIGLINGLEGLGSTTADIIAGIDTLIPGIKTAFNSSIVGISLSMLYNISFRSIQIDLEYYINQLKDSIKKSKTVETNKESIENKLDKLINKIDKLINKIEVQSKTKETEDEEKESN